MCGISGMFGSPEPSIVKSMTRLQHHRGPDGKGIWNDEHISLGHSRLAIVDLEGSPQPINSDHGCILVVNGEIYNYQQLRESNQSYPWKTMGDSESILALHRTSTHNLEQPSANDHCKWLNQLDGMFALSLWDPAKKQLILARDEMGIKPLLRTTINGSLLFASEAKAFHAHPQYTPEMDMQALLARLVWEYPLDATSLFQGVHQVRPGTVEVWSIDDGIATMKSSARFSRPMFEPTDSWDVNKGSHLLLNGFTESVGQRLMSDVPVGIVLSGGLDSSLVAAVASDAAKRYERPTPACWTVAESEDNPDWMAAELVASSLDLEHHQSIMDSDSFSQHLPSLSWHGEDLDVSVLFFQPLFKEMSKVVRVGLCGQGADEIHAGYPRYVDLKQHQQQLESRISELEHPFAATLQSDSLPDDSRWWTQDHRPSTHLSSLQNTLQFEMDHGQLSNFQLRLVDRHSMAHSLEVRVPFLGRAHRQEAMKLPMSQRLPTNGLEKKALRSAAALTNLPESVVYRKKLPAGTATSPTLLTSCLNEYSSQIKEIASKWSVCGKVLRRQPEIALGLGLFESIHLRGHGLNLHNRTLDDLLNEVIS
jgi:asparagine synthase (glutamine-hydrolysing)